MVCVLRLVSCSAVVAGLLFPAIAGAQGPSAPTVCNQVGGTVICSDGSSVLDAGKGVTIYNPPRGSKPTSPPMAPPPVPSPTGSAR